MTSRDHDRPVTRSFEHRGVTFTVPRDWDAFDYPDCRINT